MKIYLFSLLAGVLVGVIYSLLHVRSPAPPVIALIGLFGILLGEQAVPLVKRLAAGAPVTVSWVHGQCGSHIFGQLPGSPAPMPRGNPPAASPPANGDCS
ncbi:XapX domain-containing protein [Breoghania corrubedonensis]|uniref:XapX domain-containing protein n=1 Tax=Breoghania corrubedonensis TaxID=665038 RepID=A0A2T5UW21_9HYPH|nr:XapX domain-containing protein [Breoghania corrubedonensis]PTW55694.1 XapX domain-containing protein [Breoghania corrubedonensis]